MLDKQKQQEIWGLYEELVGYWKEAPPLKGTRDYITDRGVWSPYNDCVKDLERLTGSDYSHFLVRPEEGLISVRVGAYRKALSGLIHRLHSEFFQDEELPI